MKARSALGRVSADLMTIPVVARWTLVGASSLGLVGLLCGLVIGAFVHLETAPFAMLELGVPAGVLGAALGFVGAVMFVAGRKLRRLLETG